MRYLLTLALVLASGSACAMTCLIPPIEDQFRQSKFVLLVRVIDARIEECVEGACSPPKARRDEVEIEVTSKRRVLDWRGAVANVQVVESFKGVDPPTELRISNWAYSPFVTVGAEYLLYTDDAHVSEDCGGMIMISGSDREHQAILHKLRNIKRASEAKHQRSGRSGG